MAVGAGLLNQLISKSTLRTQFFDLIFQDYEGWVCLARANPEAPKSTFTQKFFRWPTQALQMENWILSVENKVNVWFCPQMLREAERKKQFCLPTDLIWADLDNVDPDTIRPEPPIVIESSPGRFQALWRLETKLNPFQAEAYAKRVAYSVGADKSGWDLTQLLRVPFTTNYKYSGQPTVMLTRALELKAVPVLFEVLPEVDTETEFPGADQKIPENSDLPSADNIVYKFSQALRGTAFIALYSQEPSEEADWSNVLWRLIHICFEAGMDSTETFSVVKDSPCNKYARDSRPDSHLWRDVLKAELAQKSINVITADFRPLIMPELVGEPHSETFINRYRDWAEEATDAVPRFHDLGAFILLSAAVSNSVRLETSYGIMVPNLWGLILGDSTLTRKTTAMRMVIDLIMSMDRDLILATEGSSEGLLTGLQERPNKTSIFYKDELSGFFDSINRKDYLAGMPETLTALYDVPPVFMRRLRKETIRVESPVFIFFGGGVRDKVYDAVTEDYVLSGFLPRFLIVSGDTEPERLRRTGPANDNGIAKRAIVVNEVANLFENYATDVKHSIGGETLYMPPRVMAKLTPDAWDKYGDIETLMVQEASNSSIPGLALPTFERLSRSLLKMAVVLSAARQVPKDETITVEDFDVINAAWYVQDWGKYSIDLISNAGRGVGEKLLDRILAGIEKHPGILRSNITQHYHLSKREADEVLATLEDRQLVRREQQGRGIRYWLT